jgi:hypothetical protein
MTRLLNNHDEQPQEQIEIKQKIKQKQNKTKIRIKLKGEEEDHTNLSKEKEKIQWLLKIEVSKRSGLPVNPSKRTLRLPMLNSQKRNYTGLEFSPVCREENKKSPKAAIASFKIWRIEKKYQQTKSELSVSSLYLLK